MKIRVLLESDRHLRVVNPGKLAYRGTLANLTDLQSDSRYRHTYGLPVLKTNCAAMSASGFMSWIIAVLS